MGFRGFIGLIGFIGFMGFIVETAQVYKELDYATNFAANGTGVWKDSGLGEAPLPVRAGLPGGGGGGRV